jgi:hypothetical protein
LVDNIPYCDNFFKSPVSLSLITIIPHMKCLRASLSASSAFLFLRCFSFSSLN